MNVWSNGVNLVVAESAAAAQAYLVDELGYDRDDATCDGWQQVADGRVLTIWREEDETTTRMAARDWAAAHDAPALIGSTEY